MSEHHGNYDAVITIEGKKYALFKKGSLSKYPYMVDLSTGEIPQGKQRSLLKSYLLLNGVNVESVGERGPHWYVRKAIKVAQGMSTGTTQSVISSPYTSISYGRNSFNKKDYLSLTEENIEYVHQQVLATSDYGSNFTLIHDVLKRFPQNMDRELVAMKVALIDLRNL